MGTKVLSQAGCGIVSYASQRMEREIAGNSSNTRASRLLELIRSLERNFRLSMRATGPAIPVYLGISPRHWLEETLQRANVDPRSQVVFRQTSIQKIENDVF